MESEDEARVELLSESWRKLIRHYNRYYTIILEKKLGGITSLELGILDQIARKQGTMIKEIKKKLHVTGSTLTAAVDRLNERGYLERVISPRDRRSFNLKMTSEGKKAHDRFLTMEREFLKKLLSTQKTPEARKGFVSMLHTAALRIA